MSKTRVLRLNKDTTPFEIYDMGYEQGKNDAIDNRTKLLAFICKKYNIACSDMNQTVEEWEYKNELN